MTSTTSCATISHAKSTGWSAAALRLPTHGAWPRSASATGSRPPRRHATSGPAGWLPIWSDLRLALRAIRRNPGFAAAVVISLALGVGGTTALFTLVHASLLRPLPYPDPDRLAVVRIWWNDFSARLSPADINTLHELAGEVAAVGAFFEPDDGFALTTASGPELTAVGACSVRGAYALARALSSVLFEIQPRDPASFALGASLLVGTALLACAIPALYSARVDPAELLRVDQ